MEMSNSSGGYMAFNSFDSWWALNGLRCPDIESARQQAENAWNAAVEFATSTNKQSTPLCSCGKIATVCDDCYSHDVDLFKEWTA